MIAKLTTKYVAHTDRVQRAYMRGLEKSLDRSGIITRRNAQRQMSRRKPKTKPKFVEVGSQDGLPVYAAEFRPPKGGKVTSWKTKRNPKGYLRSAIRYGKDMRRQSVVIGPSGSIVEVNTLQEFGGQAAREFRLVSPEPVTEFAGRQLPQEGRVVMLVNRNSRTEGEVWRRINTKTPAGRYMAQGLEKSIPALPQQFRNMVQGP